jgi:inner membrane protein
MLGFVPHPNLQPFSGKVLKLHYARAADLAPYLGMVAAEGELFVQFWMKPGDTAVELAILEQEERDAVPEEWNGYL